MNKNPPGATLPVEPYGTPSFSESHYFPFLGQKLNIGHLVENAKLSHNSHYRYKTVIFVTRTSV